MPAKTHSHIGNFTQKKRRDKSRLFCILGIDSVKKLAASFFAYLGFPDNI